MPAAYGLPETCGSHVSALVGAAIGRWPIRLALRAYACGIRRAMIYYFALQQSPSGLADAQP
jgi:hypothetical protein